MRGIRPPVLLAVCALGGGWWLGAHSSNGSAPSVPQEPKPAAAAGDVPLPESGLAHRAALFRIEETSSPADIQRLLDSGKTQGLDVPELVKKWAQRDPAGLWRWFEAGGRKKLPSSLDASSLVFSEWFRADPDAAIAALRRAGYEFQDNGARGILEHLFTTDEKLRARLLPLLDELTTTGADRLPGNGKPAEVAAKLLALPASKGRDTLLKNSACQWMSEDWKGATAWAASLTEPLKSKITASLAALAFNPFNWSRDNANDPGRLAWAGEWLSSTASVELRNRLGAQYAKALAATDPGAAFAWAEKNLTSRSLALAVTAVVTQQATQDPAKSRALAEQLPPGALRQHALFAAAGPSGADAVQWLTGRVDAGASEWGKLGSEWALHDPENFKKFITPQNVETLPDKLLGPAAETLARNDPAATLAWAAGLKSTGLAGSALEAWSYSDAPAAAAWITGHPGVSLDNSHLAVLADLFYRRSAGDAVDWAAALPPGPARDASTAAILSQLSRASSMKPEELTALKAKLGKP